MSSTPNPPGTAVIPPVSQPFVDSKSLITPAWWNYLYSLYSRTGSNVQVQSNTLATAVTAALTLAQNAESLASEALALAEGLSATSITFQNSGILAGTSSTLNAASGASFQLSGTEMLLFGGGGITAGTPPTTYTTLTGGLGISLSGTTPNLTLANTGLLAFTEGTITATGNISLGGGLVLSSGGTLQSRPFAPLVTGALPGPTPMADGLGQFIMVQI